MLKSVLNLTHKNIKISERGVIAPESKCIDHKKLLMEIYESFGVKEAKIKIDKSWDI